MDGTVVDLTDADVTDILALLDSLPYDELDLETPRFRLTLRRTPHGWTQSTQLRSAPTPVTPAAAAAQQPPRCHIVAVVTATMSHRGDRGARRAGQVGLAGRVGSRGARDRNWTRDRSRARDRS